MTRLRQMMLEELKRRNYAPRTIECYIPAVEDFARYFHRPPDQLGPEHIREYQAYLFRQRKLAPSSVTQRLAALRFFFIRTLKRPWSVAETPYPKQGRRLDEPAAPGGGRSHPRGGAEIHRSQPRLVDRPASPGPGGHRALPRRSANWHQRGLPLQVADPTCQASDASARWRED